MTGYDYDRWRDSAYARRLEAEGGDLFVFRVECLDCSWWVRRSYASTARAIGTNHERDQGHRVEIDRDGFPEHRRESEAEMG